MAVKRKSARQLAEETKVKDLSKIFLNRGIEVRREKLASGHAFRIKSGNCTFSGKNFIFVDKRLPLVHQISVLVDYVFESKLELTDEEVDILPASTKEMYCSRQPT